MQHSTLNQSKYKIIYLCDIYTHIYTHILTRVRLATVNRMSEPMIDLCRRRSNLVQNNIDIKTPVTNPVRTCAGSSRIQEWTGRAPRLIFMNCIFMDFEKRLLGGTSAWTKIEKTDRGGGEGVPDRRGLLNHYTVNRCCFQLYSIRTVYKLDDNEICLVQYPSDKRSYQSEW